MASTALTAPASSRAGRRFPALLGSRVFEQCVLGGSALLLAARLGTVAFAPIAALFVVNSAAVTLSDYGVGLAVLRCAPSERVSAHAGRMMRVANAAVVFVGLAVALVIRGDVGLLIGASAVIWWSSAEAFVQKASAINRGAGHRAAVSEIVGATAFGIPVLLFGFGSEALVVVCLALPVKHAIEAFIAHQGTSAFASSGTKPDLGALWGTQALAFGVANVDYLVVAFVLGASAFSIYTVAYRFAVAIPSMVAYVASRTLVADLAGADDEGTRQARYLYYLHRLFAVGIVAALAMSVGALLVPQLLGARWDTVTPTVIVLAVAVPWRMAFGQAGALAVAVRRAAFVVRWEFVQLLCFGIAFGAAALFGYSMFVTVSALAWIVSVTMFERGAARVAGIAGWTLLPRLAAVGVVITLAAGIGLRP